MGWLREKHHVAFRHLQDANVEKRFSWKTDIMACCQCPNCGKWYAVAGYEVNPPDEWEEDLEEDEW